MKTNFGRTSVKLKHEAHSHELHVYSVISCKSDVTEHKLVLGSYFPFHGAGGAGVGYSYTEATIFNAS